MKKSLSLLVAIAMVFSMFASVAFAAESSQNKFDVLKEAGVFTGYPDGSAGLDREMTRAEFAVVLARLNKLQADASASTYTDVVKTHWAIGQIGAVTKAKLMNGVGVNKFNPSGKVTIEQVAKTLVLSLGLDESSEAVSGNVSAWAKGYVAAAIKAQLLAPMTSYKTNATRGLLVDASYSVYLQTTVQVKSSKIVDDKNIEVTFTDGATEKVALTTALEVGKATTVKVTHKGVSYDVTVTLQGVGITKAEATGAKKVGVTFATAVDTAKVTFSLKTGNSVTSVSKVTWNEAKTVASLDTSASLATGDYTVTAAGVTFATGKDSATFTVVPERAESISLDDNGYRQAITGALLTQVKVAVKVVNQYGEDITTSYTGADASKIVVTSATAGVTVSSVDYTNKVVTLEGVGVDRSTVTLTAVETKNAKSNSKEVKIQVAKMLNEVVLSAPTIPTGKTALESGQPNVVVPYTAKDQFGNDVKLVQADIANLTFISTDTTVVNPSGGIEVIADNKLAIDFGTFDGPKPVTLTVIVNASGKSSKIEFTVNGNKAPAEPTLVLPAKKLGKGETDYDVELQVKDQYGNAMNAQEIVSAATASPSKFTVFVSNGSVISHVAIQNVSGKAVVRVTGVDKGTANLTVTVNATGKSATTAITVVDAKVVNTITAVKSDVTKAVYSATNQAAINVKATFADQYGDAITDATTAGESVTVFASNAKFSGVSSVEASPTAVTVKALNDNGINLSATEADASTVLTFKLYKGAVTAANLVDTKTITITSAKADEALTYEVEALGTIYATNLTANFASPYAKEIKVNGKDAAGNKVALPTNAVQDVFAADSSVIAVNKTGNTYKIVAINNADVDSSINVTIQKTGGVQPVNVPVKVSKAAPVATSIAFKKWNSATTATTTSDVGASISVNSGTSINFYNQADTNPANIVAFVEVKDQYGTSALSDNAAIFVTDPDGVVLKDSDGSVTFTAASGKKFKVTAVLADKTATLDVTIN